MSLLPVPLPPERARIAGAPHASGLSHELVRVLAESEYTFSVTDAINGGELVLAGAIDVALVPARELLFPLPQALDAAALIRPPQPAGQGTRTTPPPGCPQDDAHMFAGKVVAITRRRRPELRVLLRRFDARRSYGKVWLVGFGPGDPELMTVKADRVLHTADVIYYDSLIDSTVLARYPGERVFVGKRKGNHAQAQERINELLYRAAVAGKTVVRLKGGDPFIFGRGGEESEYLRRRMVAVEVVPGISAANGAAAGFNLPLTKRNISRSLTLKTAHGADNSRPSPGETQVFYMGATRLDVLARELLVSGVEPDTPVALVQNATLPNQRSVTTTVRNLPQHELAAPLLVIVGEIVRDQHVPRTVLHTGTDTSDFRSAERLIHWPDLGRPLELSSVDEVVFASSTAVERFVGAYGSLPCDILFHLSGHDTRATFVQHGGDLRTALY